MIKKFAVGFAILSLASLALAQSAKTIKLKDGSVIKGEILSLQDQVYRVQTEIGSLEVPADRVSQILYGEEAPVSAAATPSAPDTVQAATSKLLENSSVRSSIETVTQDPEIMAILSDPALIQAVTSQNPEAAKNNPNFQKLMENPKMQKLMEDASQAIGQQGFSR